MFRKLRKKSRYDQIRNLSLHEMANLMDRGADLYCPRSIDGQVRCKEKTCATCIERWLREEEFL